MSGVVRSRISATITACALLAIAAGGCSSSAGGSSGAGASTTAAIGGGSGSTAAISTTSGPSAPDWSKAHRTELRALKTAVNAVAAAFQASDDTAKKTALAQCANAATPLARTAPGSLPAAQADAIGTIAAQCASMSHDLKSGDAAAVADGKTAFDKAVVVVTPLFP